MNKILRTPESRFENLPDYPFTAQYLEVADGLHMHYVEEGGKNQPVILLLHGEPSWSYLYRKMIPLLATENYRVIAPDLIGFGKSDKFSEQTAYSYKKHLAWLTTFIVELDLQNITLFCQDWGGLLGLRIATEMPDRFDRIVASNTTLPTGKVTMPESFMKWRAFSQKSPDFNTGKVLDMGTVQPLSEEVLAAYNAPFPSEEYKAAARIFPMLVPTEEIDPEAQKNAKAWQKLMQWEKPFLTIFGSADTIMMGAEKVMQKLIPGAKGQKHTILEAGHFIQEEKGKELAKLIIDFCNENPVKN